MIDHETETEKSRNLVVLWRRIDLVGLERLELVLATNSITASGTVLCAEDGGYRLDHRWQLNREWLVQSVEIQRWNAHGLNRLRLDRVGGNWTIDGVLRPDLEGAGEPDLSATPFCNTFPINKVPYETGANLTIDTVFVDGASLLVKRSRQRYERLGSNRMRYLDLGLYKGFEAEITVDEQGLVESYEGLFERVVVN